VLSTVTAMTKCEKAVNERIDLLHKYATTSSDQVAFWMDEHKILEDRMNIFESNYVVVLFYNF